MSGTNGANGTGDDLGRRLTDRAREARNDMAKQLRTAADAIRREAQDAGGNTELADGLARGLERAAKLLRSDDVEREARRAIQRSPWMAVSAAFLVGVLAGIWLRRR